MTAQLINFNEEREAREFAAHIASIARTLGELRLCEVFLEDIAKHEARKLARQEKANG